jgi:hypothetical protein
VTDARHLAKSNQEQAVAAWIGHLNQLRLDTLLSGLARQGENLRDALSIIDQAVKKIDLEVVTTNRGGTKGMHGFIAEVAEVGIGNAHRRIVGAEPVYQWVNDNGPVDLLREGVAIQQKSWLPVDASDSAPSPNISRSTPTTSRTGGDTRFLAITST